MYTIIVLMFIWGMFLTYSFLSYRVFFTMDKLKKVPYLLLLGAAIISLICYTVVIAHVIYYTIALCSLLIIFLPILFCTGRIKERFIVAIIIYFFFMSIDICSSVIGYIFENIFSDTPIHVHHFLANSPVAIISYFISYTIIFFICLKFILIPIQENIRLFGSQFFFQWAGPFLILFLSSNGFLTLIYVKSTAIFAAGSAALLILTIFLVKLAVRNFHFYIQKEKERTQLLLHQKKLEQKWLHEKELAEQYADIRKYNHDIGNHLLTLTYLIDHKQKDAARTYIQNILKNNKEHNE